MPAPPPEPLYVMLVPGLTTVITFGLLSIAAVALLNFAGVRVHDREKQSHGDFMYLYGSDSAQEFRGSCRRFPLAIMIMYATSVLAVVAIYVLEWIVSASASLYWYPFLPLVALIYTSLLVFMIYRFSAKLYKVLQDMQGT